MISKIIKINHWLRKKYGVSIAIYPYRTSIDFIKKKFGGKEFIGAEIGTFGGENAEYILKNLNIKKLYLIDAWESYYNVYNQVKLNKAYERTLKRMKKFKSKVVILKKFSSDALGDIKELLDFVYIDGNHDYEFVKKDMENYYKKLKKGGVLAGHDIYLPGVSRAFCEFVNEKKLQPYIWSMDWWIIKK